MQKNKPRTFVRGCCFGVLRGIYRQLFLLLSGWSSVLRVEVARQAFMPVDSMEQAAGRDPDDIGIGRYEQIKRTRIPAGVDGQQAVADEGAGGGGAKIGHKGPQVCAVRGGVDRTYIGSQVFGAAVAVQAGIQVESQVCLRNGNGVVAVDQIQSSRLGGRAGIVIHGITRRAGVIGDDRRFGGLRRAVQGEGDIQGTYDGDEEGHRNPFSGGDAAGAPCEVKNLGHSDLVFQVKQICFGKIRKKKPLRNSGLLYTI